MLAAVLGEPRPGSGQTAFILDPSMDPEGLLVLEREASLKDHPWKDMPRTAVPGGWFVPKGLEAGQEVVVTGAQLLLSEELEFQIRNENED